MIKISKSFRVRNGSNPSSGRGRKFSCVTYLTETQLQSRLADHKEQIRVYSYAYHDKDVREDGTLKELHCHIVIVTYNTCTISSLQRWFKADDEEGKPINTMVQICNDVYKMYDYLTHSTVDAVAAGKYQYDKSIIVSNDDEGYFQASPSSNYDNILLATEMLLKGYSVREVGRKFGRDFIIHYRAVENYVFRVLEQQKYGESLKEIQEKEYQRELDRLNGFSGSNSDCMFPNAE